MALLLPLLAVRLGAIDTILDVAPSASITPHLRALGPRLYIRMDVGFAARQVEVLSDLTRLPHPDDSFDLIVCCHVLEHIPDDAAAMREIARVLKPGGTAVIQVPIRLGTVTDEDPDAPKPERVRRFGRADHVRFYGMDFEDRLASAGLVFQRITPRDLLGDAVVEWCRLSPRELVWIAWPADGRPQGVQIVPGTATSSPVTAMLDTALGELTRTREQVVRLRRESRRLRAAARKPVPATPVRQLVARVARLVAHRVVRPRRGA